jgi:hypothetical protein
MLCYRADRYAHAELHPLPPYTAPTAVSRGKHIACLPSVNMYISVLKLPLRGADLHACTSTFLHLSCQLAPRLEAQLPYTAAAPPVNVVST